MKGLKDFAIRLESGEERRFASLPELFAFLKSIATADDEIRMAGEAREFANDLFPPDPEW